MSSTAVALKEIAARAASIALPSSRSTQPATRRLDLWMFIGISIALATTIAGVATTGVKLSYFFQPAGALIVLGGTLGVMFVTTPREALIHSLRRLGGLAWTREINRAEIIAELMSCVRASRRTGLLALEPVISQVKNAFLRDALMLAMDVQHRADLQSALELKIRLREREGEHDAKTLEVAGGFAPVIGVLGTVIGLIDILRQFTNLTAVANGIGIAFLSTIYGLALANLILLPAAHRIRARTAEEFETQELIMEGVLSLFDRLHPSLAEERLNSFLREPQAAAAVGSLK